MKRYCSPACRKAYGREYQRQRYAERQSGSLKPRGAKPDLAKRAKVHALRDAGLTAAEIGRQLGVTRQAVHLMLAKPKPKLPSPPAG